MGAELEDLARRTTTLEAGMSDIRGMLAGMGEKLDRLLLEKLEREMQEEADKRAEAKICKRLGIDPDALTDLHPPRGAGPMSPNRPRADRRPHIDMPPTPVTPESPRRKDRPPAEAPPAEERLTPLERFASLVEHMIKTHPQKTMASFVVSLAIIYGVVPQLVELVREAAPIVADQLPKPIQEQLPGAFQQEVAP